MRKTSLQYMLPEYTSAFFILLFVYTAISKLLAIESFIAVLSQLPLIKASPYFFGYTILLTELGIALLLFIPKCRSKGLLVSAFLMMLFTLYLGVLLLAQSNLPCSCGGIISSMGWETHLLFNTLCVVVALYAWRLAKKLSKPDQYESTFYSNKQAEPKTCTTE